MLWVKPQAPEGFEASGVTRSSRVCRFGPVADDQDDIEVRELLQQLGFKPKPAASAKEEKKGGD